MQPDYSILFRDNPDFYPSWEEFYNFDLSYPENILNLIEQASVLPHDFYRIVAAYTLMPSGLTKRVPCLFFYGASGSGKTTISKLIAKIHGVTPIASSTTYAAIRNILRSNRKIYVSTPHPSDPSKPPVSRLIDANTILVWEDIDSDTFRRNPNIYVLFKVGYDKETDTVVISGKEIGTIEKFRCFAHNVLSSIHPIHTMGEYKELRRRLLVIPTKKLDDIDAELLDINSINWDGFSTKFNEFWSLDQAEIFLTIRSSLSNLKGLTSQQKTISLDLIATGVSTGIWSDEIEAVQELKECFEWINKDVKTEASNLEKLLSEFVLDIEKTAKEANVTPCIYTQQLRTIIKAWYEKSWLLEKPSHKETRLIMNKLNYRSNSKGQWSKIF
ncbi:MAG: hypothetical protein QNJ60_16500 [Xenococcaceae cyanobacterium MO_188.B19]|nr:hypothetical protein [Xenococcaceae cyanobacterium MO_188.B19]